MKKDEEEIDNPWSMASLLNGLLCVVVAIPSIVIGRYVCFSENCLSIIHQYSGSMPSIYDLLLTKEQDLSNTICQIGIFYPLWFVNILFFVNVCVVFWLISIVQKSTWLIGERNDPPFCLSYLFVFNFIRPLLDNHPSFDWLILSLPSPG